MEYLGGVKCETATVLTAVLSAAAFALYGAQQASSNQAIGDAEIIPNDLALPLAFAAAAFPIVIVWLMWHFQDNTPGNTLHKQSPGVIVFQTIMVVSCWVFIRHVFIVLTNGDCTICDYPRVFDKVSHSLYCSYYRFAQTLTIHSQPIFKKVLSKAFWVHIICAGVVSLIAPFQFIEKVRTFNNYAIHRKMGRIVLVASIFHQTSASVMLTMQLFGNEVVHFHSRLHYYCYIGSFGFFNIYTWSAIIKGWTAIRRKDIIAHRANMMRLGSMWLCVVVYQRCIVPITFWILSKLSSTDTSLGNGYIAVAWSTLFVGIVPVELYLKCGRFEDSTNDDASLLEDLHDCYALSSTNKTGVGRWSQPNYNTLLPAPD